MAVFLINLMNPSLNVTCLLLRVATLGMMSPQTPPMISSFVIRFVVEGVSIGNETQPAYRGSIRHIQTAEEINFSAWEDAVAFLRRFVPLEESGDNAEGQADSKVS